MTPTINPAAPHDLPSFITAPGGTDYLLIFSALFLVAAVLAVGLLFLRLHTLPERMAHRAHKLQFEIVAVLGLLALFTHIHLFWVAGLLLALVDLPDFSGMFGRMAAAQEKLAGIAPSEDAEIVAPVEVAAVEPGIAPEAPRGETHPAAGTEDKNHA